MNFKEKLSAKAAAKIQGAKGKMKAACKTCGKLPCKC
jgi:hypothetical protein